MANKCKRGYEYRKGKCVKVKKDSFFRPDSPVKKGVLWTALIAIVISGILGATFFLFGTFNDTTLKILSTTAVAGAGAMLMLGFSRFKDKVNLTSTLVSTMIVTGLFLLQIWEITDFQWYKVWLTFGLLAVGNLIGLLSYSSKNLFLKFAGAGVTVIAGFMWMGAIWEWWTVGETFVRWALIVSIFSFALGHVSLVNLARGSRDTAVKVVFWIVVALITIVTGMLVYLVFNVGDIDFTDMFFRVLGFFGILDIAGSITLPILKKVRG